ncbi:hypothetical protein A0H81_09613, partial [Grifola frondosa]
MIPLIPTLALAFVSFASSAFVILRILLPILPPNPLSRRVPPSEFGLPNFRSLSPADKSHVWLASCDLLALAIFTWQAVNEYIGGPSDFAIAHDPASAIRLWIAMTLRQTCLLVVASLTLLHVRMGRSVSFGGKHWMLWAPTFLVVAISTSLAGVLAGTSVESLFFGLVAYSTTVAVVSSIAFACLIGTLVIIKRNLAALNEIRDPWPPAKEVEDMPRPSFATEDIDALKDGSSWITSRASSRHDSISAFSFSTHHSARASNASARMLHPAVASHPSIPAKSSFWFNPGTPYTGRDSPVPRFRRCLLHIARPLPTSAMILIRTPGAYGVSVVLADGALSNPNDTFYLVFPYYASKYITVVFNSRRSTNLLPSMTVSSPTTPAMTNTQVLGGYGYAPEVAHAENGIGALASGPASDLDMSVYRTIGWLVTIWIPLALALPYTFMVTPSGPLASPVLPILLILSVTLSSPLLALNIIFRSPLPVPSGLFDTYNDPPAAVMRAPSPLSTLSHQFSHEYKRSGSMTVVDGRRSGDVWIANGDAIDGKSKLGRAMGLLQPKPKLAVIPPGEEKIQECEVTPPLPMQTEEQPSTVPATPQSENSAELGKARTRKESKASSYYSGASESAAIATQIMIAQRHYSALAKTMVLPPSPERRASMADADVGVAVSGVETPQSRSQRPSQHLRVRSVSSINESRFPVSPPPSTPLPPTPPSVRECKARLMQHRRSQSHSSSLGFSFGPVAGDDAAEIDALSARMLPLLVPGLKVGLDVKLGLGFICPSTVSKGTKNTKKIAGELSTALKSSQVNWEECRLTSRHPKCTQLPPSVVLLPGKRKHPLTSGIISVCPGWLARPLQLEKRSQSCVGEPARQYTSATVTERRNHVWGGELAPNTEAHLTAVREEDELLLPVSPGGANLGRSPSACTFDLSIMPTGVPQGMNSTHNSLATLITALDQELRMPPPSAASEVTLFEFDNTEFDAPQAFSTPHESQRSHSRPVPHKASLVPELPAEASPARHSKIKYIVSDENTPESPKVPVSPKSVAQWSSRAVRPLVPKSPKSKVKPKKSKFASPPGGGLRPLSLLQDRDGNMGPSSQTQPLSFGKKQNTVNDENVNPNARGKKGLKPLKLSRSETTKARAVLRQEEVLPDVVVRPPSGHDGFGYAFR